MSNYNPHNPYGGYPPQHPPGFAYMPPVAVAPVPMVPMPMYPPPQPPSDHYQQPSTQPTYVTNYYYPQNQPPPDAVQVVDHAPQPNPSMETEIDWIPANTHNADALTYKAVVAGKEPGWDSSPLWVIRAHHGGELVPGKLAIRDRRAYIPITGREVPVHNFEVLCAPGHAIRWLASSNGQVPVGAIPAGNTHNGETLYVGRVRYNRSVTPGKVHPSHGCLYISFAGTEVPHKSYEVLCRIVG